MVGIQHLRRLDPDKGWYLIKLFIIKTKFPVHLSNANLESFTNHKISPRIANVETLIIIGDVEKETYVLGKVSLTIKVKVFNRCPLGRIRSFHGFATIADGGSIKCFLKIGIDIPVEVKILVDNIQVEQLL